MIKENIVFASVGLLLMFFKYRENQIVDQGNEVNEIQNGENSISDIQFSVPSPRFFIRHDASMVNLCGHSCYIGALHTFKE